MSSKAVFLYVTPSSCLSSLYRVWVCVCVLCEE